MAGFFIDRPIFAVVIALFICLGGVLALPFLPIAQYPIIAPPSISVSTSYPGASPENLYTSVTRLIEEELNGANGILNFESTSDSLGQVEITANFVPGTDPSMASVEVQNRIKRVEARLPRAVIQQGILIEEASSAVLQIITLRSTDGKLDEVALGDFMVRNIVGTLVEIGRGEVATPEVGPRQILIRSGGVGLCGTDFHIYQGHANYNTDDSGRLIPLEERPQILGHEFCGVVVEAGAEVKDLKPGDRVVIDQGINCMSRAEVELCEYCATGAAHQCAQYKEHGITGLPGALADFVAAPAINAVKIESDLPLEEAALTEPLANAVHAFRLAQVHDAWRRGRGPSPHRRRSRRCGRRKRRRRPTGGAPAPGRLSTPGARTRYRGTRRPESPG